MKIIYIVQIFQKILGKASKLKKIYFYYLRFLLNIFLAKYLRWYLKREIQSSRNLTFLFFANLGYAVPIRLAKMAKRSRYFRKIIYKNEEDIRSLTESHKNFFLENKYRGFGCWLWKPYLIYEQLLKMHEGDILVYGDSGISINPEALIQLDEYIKILEVSDKAILCFSIFRDQKEWHDGLKLLYNKDLLKGFFPEIAISEIDWSYAGLMLIKKSSDSLKVIGEWLTVCKNESVLERYPDADNGIWHLAISGQKCVKLLPGSEINLYHDNFQQLKHFLSDKEYRRLNWSSLSKKPFIYTRFKPRI